MAGELYSLKFQNVKNIIYYHKYLENLDQY